MSDRLFREYHYGYENRDYDVLGYDFPKDKNIPYKIELDEEATDKTRDLILRLSSGETSWEEFQQMKNYWSNLYMNWIRYESGFGSGCEKKIDYKEYCSRFDLTNKKTKICAKLSDVKRQEIMRVLIVGVEPVDELGLDDLDDLDDLAKVMLQKLE